MNSNELIRLKNRFIRLKTNINSIISKLSLANDNLETIIDDINNNFQYDEVSADQNYSSNSKESINDIISDLKYNVIPAINGKINSLNNQINQAILEEQTIQ